VKDLRRLVSTLVIGSFSLAALLGIIALLSGGDFGETQTRVLLTTVVVGTESVVVLCYLALSSHRLAAVGALGGAVSLVASGTALWLTWGGDDPDWLWQTFGVALTIAASLAQASLLLALVGRDRVGPALAGTLLAIAVVAAMVVRPIVGDHDPGGDYWRIFGVVAILDVLGTVVLTALGAFRRRPEGAPTTPVLSTAVQARVLDAARDRGTSPDQLVSDALDAYLS